jgi:rhomboid protease GluP
VNYRLPTQQDSSDVSPPEFQRGPNISGVARPGQLQVKLPDTRPYVIYTLFWVTIFIFVLQLASSYILGYDLLVEYGIKDNRLIASGQLWRLITPTFLHGGIIHIAFNMYALLLFGRRLERFFGHGRVLLLYLISGFGGNVISMMFTSAPSLGSSTAIFGLLGAEAVFLYHNQKIFGSLSQRALGSIVTVAVVNLVIGLSPGIDNWGHIGGLAAGVIFTWFGGPVMGVVGMAPQAELADQRESSEVLQAAIIVVAFFSILALGAVFLLNR